ncbi:hypothetical protein [Bacillus thuringiensis]|uniref:hypothetical protein n=1 Tax=Bacillus thuringiensis TaxID=1428 RepID=UPI0037D2D748
MINQLFFEDLNSKNLYHIFANLQGILNNPDVNLFLLGGGTKIKVMMIKQLNG